MTFRKLSAIGGFVFTALAIAHLFTGVPPAPDASGEEILRFVSTNEGMRTAQVIVSLLGLLPLALFVAGLLLPFRASDRRHDEGWATSTLIGAVVLMSSIAAGDAVLYGLFLRGGAGLDPTIARALWDIEYVAYAGAGLAVAVMLGSVAIPVLRHKLFPVWHGWLSILLGVLGVLASIDVVTTDTGGVFHSLAILGFSIIWVLATSILLFRQPAALGTEEATPAGR